MLEPWDAQPVSLPSCSFWCIRTQMWDRLPATALPESSLPQLSISAPSTGLDECFLFISLVVRLPYSSIFWYFWLFFVFKLVVILLFVPGGKVYLPTPPSLFPNNLTSERNVLMKASLRQNCATCTNSYFQLSPKQSYSLFLDRSRKI